MRNIKIAVEYDGTNYAGWQIQKRQFTVDSLQLTEKKKTIQQTIEEALGKILQEKIRVIGSGRTDSGVHAQGQAANFKTKSELACKNIQRALNSILPRDIRITQARQVSADFHARFSAQSKLYRYTIVNDSFASPRLYKYAYLVKYPLDLGKMRGAAKLLVGRHDFRSFQAMDKKHKPSVRTIKRLIIRKAKNMIHLDIEAEGFLYKMARNITGTLIEIGKKRLKPGDISEILRRKNRIYAGPCAPAKGLSLVKVSYKKG